MLFHQIAHMSFHRHLKLHDVPWSMHAIYLGILITIQLMSEMMSTSYFDIFHM
jgi:hypothetical protein